MFSNKVCTAVVAVSDLRYKFCCLVSETPTVSQNVPTCPMVVAGARVPGFT